MKMKKLLVLVLIVFTAITQFLVLNNKIEELKVEVEKLQPTKEEEFIGYLLLQTSNIVFINLGEEYSEDVDAFGFSKIYVYKVEEETTFKIEIIVDNDLDFTWYINYLDDEGHTETLKPSLFNKSKSFTITIEEGYLIFDFESWDAYNNSVVTFIVGKAE